MSELIPGPGLRTDAARRVNVPIIEYREDPLVCPPVGPGYVVRLAFSYEVTEKQLESVLRHGFQASQVARAKRVDQEHLPRRKRGPYTPSS